MDDPDIPDWLRENANVANGVSMEEWIERQYAIFVTLLLWVRIQSETLGFFIQKIPL